MASTTIKVDITGKSGNLHRFIASNGRFWHHRYISKKTYTSKEIDEARFNQAQSYHQQNIAKSN